VAEMQQQLREGVDTCSRVLALQQPLPSEPVIFVSTGHLKTIDPCCLVRCTEGNPGSTASQQALRDGKTCATAGEGTAQHGLRPPKQAGTVYWMTSSTHRLLAELPTGLAAY